MQYSYASASFQSLADHLERAIAWLEELGVSVTNTRLEQYRRAMNALATHFEAGTLSQLFPESDSRKQQQAYNRYFSYFYEAMEMISIYDGLAQIQDPHFLLQLRSLAKGPHFISEETARSTISRDTAFELLIAAHLMRLGLPPESLPPADILFRFRNKNIVVECKRPSSSEMINRRIEDGFKQIRNRANSGLAAKIRGIVAVDLSKVIDPENEILWVEDQKDIYGVLSRLIDQFTESNNHEWPRLKDVRSIGIIIRIARMVFIKKTKMAVYCQQFGYVRLQGLGQFDHDLSTEISEIFLQTPQLRLLSNR